MTVRQLDSVTNKTRRQSDSKTIWENNDELTMSSKRLELVFFPLLVCVLKRSLSLSVSSDLGLTLRALSVVTGEKRGSGGLVSDTVKHRISYGMAH